MNIEKMHIVFREFAQKFGMQNVRAILDEDIDICLNTAIITIVREILIGGSNQTPYADRLIRQNVSIAPINALRNLYCKAIINGDDITFENDTTDNTEDGEINNLKGENDKCENVKTPSEIDPYYVNLDNNITDEVLIFTGFKVAYDTNVLYDCRIIEFEDLGSTFRDYCNRPTYDAPIVTMFMDGDIHRLELYNGNNSKNTNKNNFKKPSKLQCIYIRKPKEVKYYTSNNPNNIDCDLPSYLHEEIVMKAATMFMESVEPRNNRNYNPNYNPNYNN